MRVDIDVKGSKRKMIIKEKIKKIISKLLITPHMSIRKYQSYRAEVEIRYLEQFNPFRMLTKKI
jgi:hypothetical protein